MNGQDCPSMGSNALDSKTNLDLKTLWTKWLKTIGLKLALTNGVVFLHESLNNDDCEVVIQLF